MSDVRELIAEARERADYMTLLAKVTESGPGSVLAQQEADRMKRLADALEQATKPVEGRCRSCGAGVFEGTADEVAEWLDKPVESDEREALMREAERRADETYPPPSDRPESVRGQRYWHLRSGYVQGYMDAHAVRPRRPVDPVALANVIAKAMDDAGMPTFDGSKWLHESHEVVSIRQAVVEWIETQ